MSLPIHGLVHPDPLLPSLPVLVPRPAPHQPIRALPAAPFAALHDAHLSAHAPDNVLFPFLHGLEGDNPAQNLFFASPAHLHVPRFRGLLYVVCEDDLDPPPDHDSYSDSDSTDIDPFAIDIDAMDFDHDSTSRTDDLVVVDPAPHMHPVAHRPQPSPPLVVPIDTKSAPYPDHRRGSTSTSTSSSSDNDNDDNSIFPPSPIPDSSCPSPATSYAPSEFPKPDPAPPAPPPILTSTFRPRDLLRVSDNGEPEFIPPRVPDGISLRNFGIQMPIYATLSDIVVYSPKGPTRAAIALAEKFKVAIERKYRQRAARLPPAHALTLIPYNVFVLAADADAMRRDLAHLVVRTPADPGGAYNTINFAQREKVEMRELTRASEIVSLPPPAAGVPPGQVFLGNANDVPPAPDLLPIPRHRTTPAPRPDDPFDGASNPGRYDICVECHDPAPFPSPANLRAAEEHLALLDALWAEKAEGGGGGVRPPPSAGAVVHLPFPSSPPANPAAVTMLLAVVRFLERCLAPASGAEQQQHPPQSPAADARKWPIPSFRGKQQQRGGGAGTRPLKVLISSSDGYTESSVLALCLLMAVRGLSLPEAYLELQVVKGRSFFVYQGDLGVLKRVEGRLVGEGGAAGKAVGYGRGGSSKAGSVPVPVPAPSEGSSGVPAAMSSSFTEAAPMVVPSQGRSRPRASTSPLPSLFADHQAWFSDPRFDGSFPSRVLPFLYLGNLNHASNAYMLHALGITHVVSVGECALVPPPHHADAAAPSPPSSAGACALPGPGAHFIAGKGPGGQGSLWIEERAGRIKVLDIKGVCDDGIDTLEPQLEPACAWIERARAEGGRVLVHCRVGVSRSATVTIAYVMKHLRIPLVDAYLIVRSRRLSVLIQPNMRLLYNLCGWEVRLARERAGGDEGRMRRELARALSWPYLAREVHLLNEKYLH